MPNLNKALWIATPSLIGGTAGAVADSKHRVRGALIGGSAGAAAGYGVGANYKSIMNKIIEGGYKANLSSVANKKEYKKFVDEIADRIISGISASKLPGKNSKTFMTEVAPKVKGASEKLKRNIGSTLVNNSKLDILPTDHISKIDNFPGMSGMKADYNIIKNTKNAVEANMDTINKSFKNTIMSEMSKTINKDLDSRLNLKDILVGKGAAHKVDSTIKDSYKKGKSAYKIYNDFQKGGVREAVNGLTGIKIPNAAKRDRTKDAMRAGGLI